MNGNFYIEVGVVKKIFAFIFALVVITQFHFVLVLLAFGGAAYVWWSHRSGKIIVTAPWQFTTVKYLAVATLVALPITYARIGANSSKTADATGSVFVSKEDLAKSEAKAQELLDTSRKEILSGAYPKGVYHAEQASDISSPIQGKAKAFFREVSIFTSESLLVARVTALPKPEYTKLEKGEPVALSSDPEINAELNKFIKAKLPTVKKAVAEAKVAKERNDRAIAAAAKKSQAAAREEARRVEKFGTAPEPSGWDGSYRAVKDHLKATANDPDSIEFTGCTKVSLDERRGWVVGCNYRGKNAFGAKILTANWFVIRHGRVVNVLPSDSYNP